MNSFFQRNGGCYESGVASLLNSFCVVVLLVVASAHAFADESAGAKIHQFNLSVGSYIITSADASIALSDGEFGLGAAVDPQDALGVELEQSVFRLDGIYRFNESHALGFSWFNIKSDSFRSFSEDFEWVDQNGDEYLIEAGTNVNGRLRYDISHLSYQWTFYGSDKVELFSSVGLHHSEFDVDIDVDGEVDGESMDGYAAGVSSAIPLPVVGLGVRYLISQNLSWSLKSEIFSMSYDRWRGAYSDTMFAIEYFPWEHLGLAVGIGSNNLHVVERGDDYTLSYDNRMTGLTLQMALRY